MRIEPWDEDDLPLLEQLLGDPAMMEHLGGHESAEQIADRHRRYLAATAQAIASARAARRRRFVHAFPSVDNPPSNRICRKLGFTLLEECEFEYPNGSFMRCNDWRLDLFDGGSA